MMNFKVLKIEEVSSLIPDRIKNSHKGSYGKVCLLGGAVEYSGAIRLSALAYAALKSGAGLSTVAVPRFLVPIVSNNILEVMIYPIDSTDKEIIFNRDNIDELIKKYEVLTIGMGLGRSVEASKIVNYIIENFAGRLVLDADALYILSKNISLLNRSNAKIVLTPHMMEFKRLYDKMLDVETSYSDDEFIDFEKNSLNYAIEFAKTYNVTLLLKGPRTFVLKKSENIDKMGSTKDSKYSKDKVASDDYEGIRISAIDRGTPGMATAGSGDVLSGIITGFLGYIDDEFDAACIAAFVNGLAGELAAKDEGEISMTSGDTIKHIANALKLIKRNENI